MLSIWSNFKKCLKTEEFEKKSEIISPHCSLTASGVINSYQDPNSLSSDFIIVLQLLCTACWKIILFELKNNKKKQNQNNINNNRQKTYEYSRKFKSFDISPWDQKRILNLQILNCAQLIWIPSSYQNRICDWLFRK